LFAQTSYRIDWRAVLAFIICPAMPFLVIYLALRTGVVEAVFPDEKMYLNFLIMASLISIPASWLFGIPLYLWFRKQNITSLTAYIVGGGGISVVLSLPFVPIVVAALPLGLIISTSIWLVTIGFRRAKPDQP